MRGVRRFAWLAATAAVLGLGLGSGAVGAATTYVNASGELSDLQVGTANATDGATARVWAISNGTKTTVWVVFEDLDPAAAGTRFGAHIHVGPCVEGIGSAAGPHYNAGGPPSPSTEVWLDFTVRAGGFGSATTTVPFVIPPGGAQSLVVHVAPTAPSGAAGARQACLPVEF